MKSNRYFGSLAATSALAIALVSCKTPLPNSGTNDASPSPSPSTSSSGSPSPSTNPSTAPSTGQNPAPYTVKSSYNTVSTLAGLGTLGFADGATASAEFDHPYGVAVDGAGNVYVADHGNNCLRKITPAGQVYSLSVAGSTGTWGQNPTPPSYFSSPWGLAMDASGDLFVTDQDRVTEISSVATGGTVSTIAGAANSSGTTDGPEASALFSTPAGIVLDGAGNIYVADSGNGHVRKISGGTVTTLTSTDTWATNPSSPYLDFELSGIAIDRNGNLFLTAYTDMDNSIHEAAAGGTGITVFSGVTSPAGYANGTLSAARFNWPMTLVFDGSGNLVVADTYNNSIREITSGTVSTIAGTGASSGSLVNGSPSSANFDYPDGVALDASGDIYVGDQLDNVVRVIR